uniref:PH domain-containing protein n=1 Tax=Tanacetum cinerariifolium TaxID=118510 RepID=A0A6L2L4Z8_TANCI|nr:hypothetical protein [Tanacetum cinerariifolium]
MSSSDVVVIRSGAAGNAQVERDIEHDESILIWFIGKEKKQLRLSHVTRIVSGQQIIYKDKDEAEVWFSGLKALISRGHQRNWSSHSRNDEIPSEANSPRAYRQRSSPLHSPFGSGNSSQKDIIDQLSLNSPYGSPPKNGQEKTFPDTMLYKLPPKSFYPPIPVNGSVHSVSSGGSDSMHGHMRGMLNLKEFLHCWTLVMFCVPIVLVGLRFDPLCKVVNNHHRNLALLGAIGRGPMISIPYWMKDHTEATIDDVVLRRLKQDISLLEGLQGEKKIALSEKE